MEKVSSTKIPTGSKEFYEAVERLKNAGPKCTNKNDLASYCCKLCGKASVANCEDCYVQTVGDLADPFRNEMQEGTSTGVYSSGFYKNKKGKYCYTHPQGSG